jgi:hypothetical protein
MRRVDAIVSEEWCGFANCPFFTTTALTQKTFLHFKPMPSPLQKVDKLAPNWRKPKGNFKVIRYR